MASLIDLIADPEERTRNALAARVRLALLEQDQWWVPAPGWQALCEASITGTVWSVAGPQGEPIPGPDSAATWSVRVELDTFDHPAKVRVADLGVGHARNLRHFLWRHTPAICLGIAAGETLLGLLGPQGDHARDAMDRYHEVWMDRAFHEDQRLVWFEELPLIKALPTRVVDVDPRRVDPDLRRFA